MRNFLATILILSGIVLGLYFGGWVMLIGGIIQIVNACKSDVSAIKIAVGVIRILFSGFVGWGSFALCTLIGGALVKD